MIRICEGSIFDADVDVLVDPVNTVGVMGAGLAKEFKKRYPEMYGAYRSACDRGHLHHNGKTFILFYDTILFKERRAGEADPRPRYIACLPTKIHWRETSRLDLIEVGLRNLVSEMTKQRIRSVAIPALGCGLGGLDWADVLPLIERVMGKAPDIETHIYQPKGG